VYYVKYKRQKNNFVNENGKLNLFFLIFFFFSLSECQLLASATLLTPVCRLPDILACFSLVLMNLKSTRAQTPASLSHITVQVSIFMCSWPTALNFLSFSDLYSVQL